MNAPDRVSADLRQYEAEQDGAEQFNERVDAEARELAQASIESSVDVGELIENDPELVAGPIARCMREFDQAAVGNPVAILACLNALSHIQKNLAAKAFDVVRDKAIRNVERRAENADE